MVASAAGGIVVGVLVAYAGRASADEAVDAAAAPALAAMLARRAVVADDAFATVDTGTAIAAGGTGSRIEGSCSRALATVYVAFESRWFSAALYNTMCLSPFLRERMYSATVCCRVLIAF